MKRFFKIFLLGSSLSILGLIAFNFFTVYFDKYSSKPNKQSFNLLKDGYYSTFYSTGELKSKEFLLSGQKHGVWKYYYKNGQLKSRIPYYKNQIEGMISHYHYNGDLIYQEVIQGGRLISKSIYNDSLYKYEVSAYLHGKTLFETSCDNCHDVSDISKNNIDTLKSYLSVMDDTAGYIPKDSIHNFYNASVYEMEKGKRQYSIYDLHSISEFIEQSKPYNHKIYRLRKIRPIGL